MLKLVLVASLTLPSAAMAQNKLTPIQGTMYDHGLVAKSDGGDSAITAREMLVDVVYNGRPRKGALVIYYDSASGRYMWEFAPVPVTESAFTMTGGYGRTGFVYKASDRLIIFGWGHPTLMIQESFTKANGIDDAESRALSEATARLPAKMVHATDDRIVINIAKLLPSDFPLACVMCSGPAPMEVLDVTHKGNTWEITLQGQWKEKITLDEKYQITGTTRIN